jgi:hypothetical protein
MDEKPIGDRTRGEAGRCGSPIIRPSREREAGRTLVDQREAGCTLVGRGRMPIRRVDV